MRIVQLLTQSTGGPVDHATEVAVALAARGHDSHVIGPENPRTAAARSAGVTWHALEVAHKRDIAGAVAVARRLIDLRPEVVHLQDRRAGWLGRLIAPAMRRSVAIYTLHGVPDGLSDLVAGNVRAAPRRRRDTWYYLRGERWVARWSGSEVVVPSAAVARFARDHIRLPDQRVHVVANGIDALRFSPPEVPAAVGPELVVVWLGLLVHVKRVELLLEAVSRVGGLRLVVAGDGPLRARVERAVDRLRLTGRVDLLGAVRDVPGLFARAELFVLSSAAENCPLSLLQAMACGLPVVATSVGGVPEVVRDGVDGLLVPADDVEALAEALRRLVADPDRRRRMGLAARVRIEDGYTIETCVDGLERIYAQARPCVS